MAEEKERTRQQGMDRGAAKRPDQRTTPEPTTAEDQAGKTQAADRTIHERTVHEPASPAAPQPVRTTRMDTFGPTALAILRIGAGLLFMQHGVQKLFGWLGGFGGEPGATAELFSLMGLAGVLETFGGLLIVLGLLTRPVAVILAIEMVVAFFMAHFPQGGFPVQNNGELPLLYALVFILLAALGPGAANLDRLMSRRSRDVG